MVADNAQDFPLAVLCFLITLLCQFQTSAPQTLKDQDDNYKRVCYYTNWSQYRPGNGRFMPSDIDPFLCTHLIFAFAKVDRGVLAPYEWNDMEPPFLYKQFTDLKKKNPKLKTLLAVGGWNHGSLPFTAMVGTAKGRSKFIQHAIKYLRSNRFDGLDLDWEYPAGRGSPAQDKQNFVSLAKELREAFEKEAKKSGQDRLLLTMAVPGGEKLTLAGYDVRNLNKYVDFFNLMTYDLHGGWSSTIGHHAPLQGGNTWAPDKSAPENVNKAVNLWLKLGADPHKLVMGLAFYGKTFKLCTKSHQVGNKSCGAGRPESLPYHEILKGLRGRRLKRGWLDKEKVPFAVSEFDRLWVGYDDEQSLLSKVNYAKKKGLGGVMVWSLDQDDFTGRFGSHGTKYPLLTTIREALVGGTVTQPRFSFGDEKSDKDKFGTNLKPRSESFKRDIKENSSPRKEKKFFTHPSAVPLSATMIGRSNTPHKGHREQIPYHESFRKHETNRKHTLKALRHSKHKEEMDRERKRTYRNKQIDHRDIASYHDKKITDTLNDRKPSTERSSRRLIRGKRRRNSTKRKHGKSPHRKTPILYHPVHIKNHQAGSHLSHRAPASPLSVQRVVSDDEVFVNSVLDPWQQQRKTHSMDASANDLRHRQSKEQKNLRDVQRKYSEGKVKSLSRYVHPFSDSFSASVDINERDEFAKFHDKTPPNSKNAREKVSLPSDRSAKYSIISHDSPTVYNEDNEISNEKVDKYRQIDKRVGGFNLKNSDESSQKVEGVDEITRKTVDEKSQVGEDVENSAGWDSVQDPEIEVEVDAVIPVEPEYEIIRHEPSYKWYEPILYKQKDRELDLQLAQAVPYSVPWRAEKEESQTKEDIESDGHVREKLLPERHRASQFTPYSGDKFVRVHAVPLSGFSLADIVREDSSSDFHKSSDAPIDSDTLKPKDQHLKKYHAKRPWFSEHTESVRNDNRDGSLKPVKDSENDKKREGTTQHRDKQDNIFRLQRQYDQYMRRLPRRRLRPKTHSQDLKNSSVQKNVTENLKHGGSLKTPKASDAFDDGDQMKQRENMPTYTLKVSRKTESRSGAERIKPKESMYISNLKVKKLPQSFHNDDVWWELPEIETYQAMSIKQGDNSSSSSDLDSNTSTPSEFEAAVTIDRDEAFLEADDFELSKFSNKDLRVNPDNQSQNLIDNEKDILCHEANECNQTAEVSDIQSEKSYKNNDTGNFFVNLVQVQSAENSLSADSTENATLSLLHNSNLTNPENKTYLKEFHTSACVGANQKLKSLNKTDLESFGDDHNEDGQSESDCNFNDTNSTRIQKQRANLPHKRNLEAKIPAKPMSYSALRGNSKRRKAGRKNVLPHPYRSIERNRSPFKPPAKAALYHSSSISRKRHGKAGINRSDNDMLKHRHHKFERLRQLLRNSSVVEKLKLKLEKLRKKSQGIGASSEEHKSHLNTSVVLKESNTTAPILQRSSYTIQPPSEKFKAAMQVHLNQEASTTVTQHNNSSHSIERSPGNLRSRSDPESLVVLQELSTKSPTKHKKPSKLPWYEQGSQRRVVKNLSSSKLETESKEQEKKPEESKEQEEKPEDFKTKETIANHENSRPNSHFEVNFKKAEKGEDGFIRQSESEERHKYEDQGYHNESHRLRYENVLQDEKPKHSGSNKWWARQSDRGNRFETAPTITEKGLNGSSASTTAASIHNNKVEGIKNRRRSKSKRKDVTKFRRLPQIKTELTKSRHLSGSGNLIDYRENKPSKQVVGENELTSIPRNELYKAKHSSTNRTTVSMENITGDNFTENSNITLTVPNSTSFDYVSNENNLNTTPMRLPSQQQTNTTKVAATFQQLKTDNFQNRMLSARPPNTHRVRFPVQLRHKTKNSQPTNAARSRPIKAKTTESSTRRARLSQSTSDVADVTTSTVTLLTAENKPPENETPVYPEPEAYKVKGQHLRHLEPESIKRLLREDGRGGWSFMKDTVTPAPIPGASLVASGFNPGGFSCPSTFGIYRDPGNCRMFYQCVWFVAFHHRCGQGTAWNDYDRICDWPLRTSC